MYFKVNKQRKEEVMENNEKPYMDVMYAPSLRELIDLVNECNKNALNPISREDIVRIFKDHETGLFYLIYYK